MCVSSFADDFVCYYLADEGNSLLPVGMSTHILKRVLLPHTEHNPGRGEM